MSVSRVVLTRISATAENILPTQLFLFIFFDIPNELRWNGHDVQQQSTEKTTASPPFAVAFLRSQYSRNVRTNKVN